MIIVNSFQSLTIITKRSILDIAAALDPPLVLIKPSIFLKISVPSNSTELSSLRTTFKSPNFVLMFSGVPIRLLLLLKVLGNPATG